MVHLGGNDLANPQWSPELLADEYISYYGNAGRVVVFCSIVYRVRPRNVSSETFAEQADRFNSRLKERCSANSHLLFWNHGRLGPYTVMAQLVSALAIHCKAIGSAGIGSSNPTGEHKLSNCFNP